MAHQYDQLIIGAGSAGALLAARLSQDPTRSVLLLEAGPDFPDPAQLPADIEYGFGTPAGIIAASHDWHHRGHATDAALAATPTMAVPRGKLVGGSGAINAQIFLRAVPEDFQAWVDMGNDAWSFDVVLPYFRLLERDLDFQNEFHGASGLIPVARAPRDRWRPDQAAFYSACREAGFADCPDQNHPGSSGVGPFPLNTLERIRQSTALTYLAPARVRPNLTILPDCTVQQLLFRGRRATGIAYQRDGTTQRVSAGEILLCAGAIGSPQLLMLSGVGAPEALRGLGLPLVHALPGVGQNLRDHPAAPLFWPLRDDYLPGADTHWHQVGLRYTAAGSPLVNDMIVYVGADPVRHQLLMRPTVNLALGAGELSLASSDPAARPTLRFRYLTESADRTRLREAVRLCIALADHETVAPLLLPRTKPTRPDLASDRALDEWLLRSVVTGHHICGTCKMGPATDPLAVVDQAGRVHGLEGLRVVDASILPDCVRANIHATVLMMAERLVASP